MLSPVMSTAPSLKAERRHVPRQQCHHVSSKLSCPTTEKGHSASRAAVPEDVRVLGGRAAART